MNMHALYIDQDKFEAAAFDDISGFDAYIFFRPYSSRALNGKVLKLKSAGRKVIAAYDDLIFDVSSYRLSSSVKAMGGLTLYQSRYRDWENAFEMFDEFIHSTKQLALEAARLAPHAKHHVVPNFLPPTAVSPAKFEKKAQTIGYFGGGLSHKVDVNRIAGVLYEFLSRNNMTLQTIDTFRLHMPSSLAGVTRFFPRMNYTELQEVRGTGVVEVAPLVRDRNSDCKSGIKYIEAINSLNPVVCDYWPAIDELPAHQSLIVASDLSDWLECLEKAVSLSRETDVLVREREDVLEHAYSTAKRRLIEVTEH